MSTTLYVRLPHRPHDQPQPWHFGALPFALVRTAVADRSRRQGPQAAGQLLREGHARIAELPPAERLVLIMAASDVLLTGATVPPLAPARLKLALPNLVEDALATDAQPCHIAVGPALDALPGKAASGSRRRLLMVTDRAWLRAVLDAFAEHRHRRRHVLPAQLCLPLPLPPVALPTEASADAAGSPRATTTAPAALALEAASLTSASPLFETQGLPAPAELSRYWQLTVRSSEYAGYGLLLGSEALAAWQGLAPTGDWYASEDALAQVSPPAAHPLDWRVWLEGAQASLREPALDLAQFEFAQGRADRWNLKAWRLPLALAAGLVVVQLIGMNVQWLLLRQEAQRLAAGQEQTLRSAFPQIPVVIDPPLQMRRQVDQLRLASGRSTPDDFLPLADRFGQAARQLAPDALLALEYRGHTLFATLKPGTDTNALRSAARQSGLAMEADNSPPDASRANAPAGTRWSIKPSL
ncbi:general secretion pathway protein L [Cupriavidus basilensis OR16]|uniref:General secretion pathway protein L n=1 Tax=Cupriavidus basilensis OR16 TaxID=1127483 RepID=H1S0J1_9BURK|nr:type II secretion system protein GspL [Cupriavidus basilensis]EHP43962.1 general secretion pathway protein L [Cupriavidus basilensis OR16]